MPPAAERHFWTALDLAAGIANRELSPVEIAREMLERVARVDPSLHAFVRVLPEHVLAEAKALEAEIAEGRPRGPLHGVPIAVKDLCDVAGEPTRAGTAVLDGIVAERDACVVERLREAGALILGRLAMTEGAFTTHHPSVPAPVNPWAADAWTGISSSGSGVAVAAGLCFAALGTDTGGSIRFPSACNGVVGLKATHGRVPLDGVFPLALSLDHIGPMARCVGDVATVFEVIAGGDARDPASRWAPVPGAAEIGSDIRGLRIGFDPDWSSEGGDPERVALVLDALEVLRERGAVVHEIAMPDTASVPGTWTVIAAADAANAHARWFPDRADEYGPELRRLLELGRGLGGRGVADAVATRTAFSRQLEALFGELDVLLCPALSVRLPADTNLGGAVPPANADVALRFTAAFDLSGSPSLTLPCGFTTLGEPVGLQLIGPQLGEATVLRAGLAYEAATQWHTRHPEVDR